MNRLPRDVHRLEAFRRPGRRVAGAELANLEAPGPVIVRLEKDQKRQERTGPNGGLVGLKLI